jgi:signal transduction histidine kinase/ligand-binding sensor domain-containing protein
MRLNRIRSRIWIHLTLLCIAPALPPVAANAQSIPFQDSWRWAHFTTESGLPSDQVFCITETPDGTIWAGTQKGLAWFDGYFWNSLDIRQGIPADQIALIEPYGRDSVFCTIHGVLYLGGKNGFKLMISGDSTQSVVLANKGQILVLGGDDLFMLESNRLRLLSTPAHPISTGPRNLWRTSTGNLWLNTVRGLYRGDGRRWSLVVPSAGYSTQIQNVVEDRKGNGLAAVVFPRDFQGIREWKRGGVGRLSSSERSGGQLAMDVSPAGDVLVAYEYGDIRLRHQGLWSSIEPRPKEFNSTHALKFGTNGDLWVGTEQGLFLFRTLSKRWTYWKHPFGDRRNGVHEITRTSDGSIWLGTLNGLEIHRPNGRVEYIESILGTALGTITCIAEDRLHHVWIGSGASFPGAFRWNGKSWKHFGEAEGLKADRIHKIRMDRSGDLWFLGLGNDYKDLRNQPGAYQYKDGKFIHWGEQDSVRQGLIHGRVYAFAEGRDRSLWFGTYRGISRWKDGVWKHWSAERGLQGKPGRIYALAVDSLGSVWFSNLRSGLGTVSSDDSVHFFTAADGLVDDAIWDLKVDESGVLWMSTQRGISSYSTGVWSSFTIRNGLNTPILWDLLPLKDRVYIGSPGSGVNILNRAEPALPPKVKLVSPSFIGTTAIVRLSAFPYLGEIDPKDVEIRHQLDDNQWSDWSTQREILLTHLASGDHKIEVQAKGLFGNFDPTGETLTFEVEPSLLKRPSVVIGLVLLLGSFSVLVVAYLNRKRNYQKALQKNDERFHLVASTTADVIYDWNLGTGEVWINDPLRSGITGPLADIREARETWLGRVHPEDRPRLENAMAEAVSSISSSWQAEYRSLKTDGTYGHMLHRGHFEFDESGKLVRALGSIMEITERKRAEDLSRSLSRRIIEAQEGERRRVSRDLHDSVNQILASVKFRIESLEEQLPGRNKGIRHEAHKARLLLKKVMTEIRRISRNLRPAELDDLGLGSAVRSLADEFSERTKIATIVKDGWPTRVLSSEVTLTLYRIIQEALTNIEKHAKAKRVRIGYTETATEIICTIEDNGLGMRTDEHGKSKGKGGGLGLLDMQERLSFIGGTLEISAVPRRGTIVTIHIPLTQPQSQDPPSA